MRKIEKNILMFMFFTLCFVFAGNVVHAEKKCTTYKNYYFFNMITSENSSFSTTEGQVVPGVAYFRRITNVDNPIWSDVCLYKTSASECAGSGESMSYKDFYTHMKAALSQDKTYDVSVQNLTYEIYVKEEKTDDMSISYITHTKWEDEDADVRSGVNLKNRIVDNMVAATIKPTTSCPNPTDVTEGYQFTVTRTSGGEAMKAGTTSYTFDWGDKDNEKNIPTLFAPALKLAQYELCQDVKDGEPYVPADNEYPDNEGKLYTAKIYYLYKDTNKTAATTHNKQYADGDGERVISPTISGCTPDLANVDIKINGANFEKTVYYTCAVNTNPKTGNALFIVCMIVGFSSLGYFLYWLFIGRKKANQEV